MKKRYEDDIVLPANALARKEVALQMRNARKKSSLTQQELADLSGTKKSNISRMESGKYNPSLDFMVKICEVMGRSLTIKVE